MITEEKYERFERMSSMAERIVARCSVDPPLFSEHGESWARDQVVMLTEGYLAGRRFGAWIPVARQMYDNEEFRNSLLERGVSLWRGMARSRLFDANLLLGPKGKLPA